MRLLTPTPRVGLSLVCIAASIGFFALAYHLAPDDYAVRLAQRTAAGDQLALLAALALERCDVPANQSVFLDSVTGNPTILSAGVRNADGKLMLETVNHREQWRIAKVQKQNTEFIQLPIVKDNRRRGTLELRFEPLRRSSLENVARHRVTPILLGFGAACIPILFSIVYRFRRTRAAASYHSIPAELCHTIKALPQEIIIIDSDGSIVLANDAFAQAYGSDPGELQGLKISGFDWNQSRDKDLKTAYPWEVSLKDTVSMAGTIREQAFDVSGAGTLSIDSNPLIGEDETLERALASCDDLSQIEQKNTHLKQLLEKLQKSRIEIARQNQQLRDLARKDSLTGCLNRRAFFSEFESQWSLSKRYNQPLACVMVDVDNFKLFNDHHGHSTGDQVLQQVAATLEETIRQSDVICRYGGEEFCVLLPRQGIDQATQAAERFRREIETIKPKGLTVTVSVGVSSIELGAGDIQELIDQADRCLYVAKRIGRNRVVRWDFVPKDQCYEDVLGVRADPNSEEAPRITIPFHAVTALLSALAYRHAETVEHSRRVADLCVAAADSLLSHNDRYVLEVAALLHDVGKLGVPDAILLKAGPLTESEWKTIKTHEAIGNEIITAAFSSKPLTEIIRYHHCSYQGDGEGGGKPVGNDIPLGARLLKIADAYDAMVTDQVYRQGRSRDEAFAELRRFAGSQFDPELVEHFIASVSGQDAGRTAKLPSLFKRSALQIGLQLEKLAIAADVQDRATLISIAGSLHNAAEEAGIAALAENAQKLRNAAESGQDMDQITEQTLMLIELCRSTCETYSSAPEPQLITN